MRPEPLLTRPFVLAFAAHFLHALAFSLYLHLPGFLSGLGASEVEIGLVFGLAAGTAILVRPALGRAMDTRGRRVVILAGGLLHTLVCALYLSVSRLGPWVYAVRIGHGVGEAMLFASLFAFAADIVPARRRIEGIALFGVSGMLPMSVGGLLGDLILAHAGYRLLFATSVVLAASAFAISLPMVEPKTDATLHAPPRGILAALRQRDLLPVWFVGMLFATALAAHFTFLKTFVLELGEGTVGMFFTAYAGAAIALRIFFGSLPERVGAKRVLFPAMISMALGLMLLAVAQGEKTVTLAGVLCGLGHGFVFPILVGIVVGRALPRERGAALALYTALFDAGTMVGGPLLGGVIRLAGYPAMFATAAALVVVGLFGFVYWDRAHG